MASEDKLGVDFADVYANSGLAKCASLIIIIYSI